MERSPLSASAELRRTDLTGMVWFGAATIASAVVAAGALAEHWNPGHLQGLLAVLWWIVAGLVVLSLGALAWSGCPIFGDSVERADRDKSITIRVGVVLYLIAGSTATAIVLVTS